MRGRKEKPIRLARRLRVNQTDAETALWNRIRNRRIDGHARQVPIGSYICDFVCREKLVVIEVDGGQHAESERDAIRDRCLVGEGYRVLRFWNNDVLGNLEGVLLTIQAELSRIDALTPPSPREERGEGAREPGHLTAATTPS